MEPWYNVFSYWGFILLLLRPFLPFSILSILVFNLIGTLVYLYKARPNIQFGIFLLAIQVIPVWVARRDPFQVMTLLVTLAVYMLFLTIQGVNVHGVYAKLVADPPGSIQEYLMSRLGPLKT